MSLRIRFSHRLFAFAVLGIFLLGLGSIVPPTAPAAIAAAIDPQVLDESAAAPDGQTTFLVYLRERADLADAPRTKGWTARGQHVTERLQAVARASQADILNRLAYGRQQGKISSYQPFWIANVITVTGDRPPRKPLARTTGVAAIMPAIKIDPPEPPTTKPHRPLTLTARGASRISARTRSGTQSAATGRPASGTVIGLVDTGVQWDHAALRSAIAAGTAHGGPQLQLVEPRRLMR